MAVRWQSPLVSFLLILLLTYLIISALATLFEEYVRSINSPGAVPIVQSAWDVYTKTKCTEFLEIAKEVYE